MDPNAGGAGVSAFDTPVSRLATGMSFTEGPCWLPAHGRLLFTDIPANRIMAWDVGAGRLSVWSEDAHFAIGLSLTRDGRLIVCEHSTRSLSALTITREGGSGVRSVLARSVAGRVLNSTNDTIAARDGTILFTDPPFGVRSEVGVLHGYQQAMELPVCGVWRVTDDPDAPALMTGEVYRPNGLCLSPDESVLYVSDSSDLHHKVLAFDVGRGWQLGPARDFAVMPVGVPDGMRVDTEGCLWVGGGDGVYVYDPDGRQIGHAPVPEMVTNLAFGGDGQDVFITAVSSLYHLRSRHRGA
jgi:gluconolactonase